MFIIILIMPKIKFHDNIAIADTAFSVKGKNVNELFENSAKAMIMSMADLSSIKKITTYKITLNSDSLDTLLYDFLNEILIVKDNENLIFSEFKTKVKQTNNNWNLKAICKGEYINPKKHKIKIDIKAVTMHMFEVTKDKDGYSARIVVDI